MAPGTGSTAVVGVPAGTCGTARLTSSLGPPAGGHQSAAPPGDRRPAPQLLSLNLHRAGGPSLQGAYGGNQDVSFGLQVAAGTVMSAPTVTLTDQFGGPVSPREYRGKVVILANFLTECQETCPLVAAALLQRAVSLDPRD